MNGGSPEIDGQLVHLLGVEELADSAEADVLAREPVTFELREHERLKLLQLGLDVGDLLGRDLAQNAAGGVVDDIARSRPYAENTPGWRGTTTRGIASARAMSTAYIGPEPPKPQSAKSRGS